MQYALIHIVFISQETLFLQSIPSEMEFDPNSNPPCYKTVDEVRIFIFISYNQSQLEKKKTMNIT